ncbi:MAG TPA: DUF302 domain-containing protein, partial [Nitrospiria bacterium]|nr:DUF302 domain-containing protein [Nitrospiria bacterium]
MSGAIKYGFSKTVPLSHEEAIAKVTGELKKEGFGVLTEIKVTETLKEKLGVDFRKYRILGACNPPLAYQALTKELELGLFLPCNVIVYENDSGATVVTAIDPIVSLWRTDNPDLEPIARQAAEKLQRAINA